MKLYINFTTGRKSKNKYNLRWNVMISKGMTILLLPDETWTKSERIYFDKDTICIFSIFISVLAFLFSLYKYTLIFWRCTIEFKTAI